jgi:hypothetical protein
MILESAQLLSTVLGGPYKPTHKNHPCTKWVATSRQNAAWLYDLMYCLNKEYKWRFNKINDHISYHKCDYLITALDQLPDIGQTPFVQVMPDEYKSDDAVTAYRAYYKTKTFAEWRKGQPEWW